MSVILPHENPWLSEWFGDARCEKMGLWIESLKKGIQKPIPYDLRGCVHQGRWLDNAIDFLNEQHISVDYSKRGLYSDYEVYKSIRFRLKLKYWIYKCGMMGSYMDLWKRKPIHK